MSRADDASQLIIALASAVQSAGLYPPGHPNREDVTTDVVVRVRRLFARHAEEDEGDGGVPPLFVVRHAFYLGPSLLAAASLDHDRLISAFEEAGVAAVEFRPDVTPQDIDALLQILRGELSVTAPVPGLAINQIEPAVGGVGTAARGVGRSIDFARQTVAGALRDAAAGQVPDVETITRVARQLTSDVLTAPARAVLMAVAPIATSRSRAAQSVDTAVLAVATGYRLGRTTEQLVTLAAGALVADIGLALLPDAITDHHEPLTAEQRRTVHRHPVDGATLLLSSPEGILAPAATIALQHHARVDGGGYPQLGVGVRPCVDAQLVGIADTYTALIRPREYRRPARGRHALATVLAERDHAWDGGVVDALVGVLGTYPVGSYVRLTTGELALVTRTNDRVPDRPVVRLVRAADGGDLDGEVRDTAEWDGFGFPWTIAGSADPVELTVAPAPAAPTGTP